MPIARNLAASGGRSSNPRERANQYQGPPSSIAVVKTAVMVGDSLHFVFPIPFKNIQQGHSSLAAPYQLFFFYIGGEEKWSGSSSIEDLSARAPASNEIHSANCNNNTRHAHFCRRILQCGRVSQRILIIMWLERAI